MRVFLDVPEFLFLSSFRPRSHQGFYFVDVACGIKLTFTRLRYHNRNHGQKR